MDNHTYTLKLSVEYYREPVLPKNYEVMIVPMLPERKLYRVETTVQAVSARENHC